MAKGKNEKESLALLTPEELDKTGLGLMYTKDQLKILLQKTPDRYIKTRQAKGGGTWNYVTGGYIKKVLNIVYNFNWSFEIIEQDIQFGEVVVKGKLTVHLKDSTITKMQFGNKEIVFKNRIDANGVKHKTDQPLSIGNDMKAAATDCLKKCAAELGIAADIYNKDDFERVLVVDKETKEQKQFMFEEERALKLIASCDDGQQLMKSFTKEFLTDHPTVQEALDERLSELAEL